GCRETGATGGRRDGGGAGCAGWAACARGRTCSRVTWRRAPARVRRRGPASHPPPASGVALPRCQTRRSRGVRRRAPAVSGVVLLRRQVVTTSRTCFCTPLA